MLLASIFNWRSRICDSI